MAASSGELTEEPNCAAPNSDPFTNDDLKRRIRRIFARFVTDVDPIRLSDYLNQEGVITINLWQRIEADNKTNQDRCRALLNHLFTITHPDAFIVVRRALESENEHILKAIDDLPATSLKANEPLQLLKTADEEHSARDVQTMMMQRFERLSCSSFQSSSELDRMREELEKERSNSRSLAVGLREVKQKIERMQQEIEGESWTVQQLRQGLKEMEQMQQQLIDKVISGEQFTPNDADSSRSETPFNRSFSCRADYGAQSAQYDETDGNHSYRPESGGRLQTRQALTSHSANKESKAIMGLATLHEELFIVSRDKSVVEVYDARFLNFIRQFKLSGLVNPVDIGSCKINQCLFIIDQKFKGQTSEVLRVDSNGKLIGIWAKVDDYHRLSVTDELTVVLTFLTSNLIREYLPDGQLIREIRLSSCGSRVHPVHVVQLASGNFVVSHGAAGGGPNAVSLADADGRVLKSFSGEMESTVGQLNHPVFPTVNKSGWIILADMNNSRILLLDSKLTFKRELVSKERHGLRYPLRICLEESSGRLLVANNDYDFGENVWIDGRVLVSTVK